MATNLSTVPIFPPYFLYDDPGNRTSRTETSTGKVTEYAWDHRNRLSSVKDRNTAGGSVVKQVDYTYDAFNRLVKRTHDADGAGAAAATNQYWVYDQGINAVLQFDGPAASHLTHRYLWTGVVDELMADETVGSGADTLYALADHLGTIRDIANFNESTSVTTVTNHRTYNSFGKLTAETNAAVDLIFGYTGKQLDEATGLQHNLFRWYDSGLGQWLSEDPIGFAAGDENVRRYVGNGSITRTDPTGLEDPAMNQTNIYLIMSGFGHWPGLTDVDTGQVIRNPSTPFASSLGNELTQLGLPNSVIRDLPVVWDRMNERMKLEFEKQQQAHPGTTLVWIALGAGLRNYQIESVADNSRRTDVPDALNNYPGKGGVSFFNDKDGKAQVTNAEAEKIAKMLASVGVINSTDAGDFLCESAAYYVETAKVQGLIGSGFFIHIPSLKYDTQVSLPKVKEIADVLKDYYGPDADPDGDGIPNKNDANPFIK